MRIQRSGFRFQVFALVVALAQTSAGIHPIKDGLLQTDMDADGNKIRKLDADGSGLMNNVGRLVSVGPSALTGNLAAGSNVTLVADGRHNAFGDTVWIHTVGQPDKGITVYRSGTTHTSADGVLKVQTSTNGGQSWLAPVTIYDDTAAGNDSRDPCIVRLSDKRIGISFTKTRTTGRIHQSYVMFSTDNAATWGTPVAVSNNFTAWDFTSARLVERNDGAYLLPIYGINTGDTNDSAALCISTDKGAHWSQLATVKAGDGSNQFNEHWIGYLADATTLMSLIRKDVPSTNVLWRSLSTNGGASWSSGAAATISYGASRPAWQLLPSGGIVLVAGNGSQLASYSTSWDDGLTWVTNTFPVTGNRTYGGPALMSPNLIGCAYFVEPSLSVSNAYFEILIDGYAVLPNGRFAGRHDFGFQGFTRVFEDNTLGGQYPTTGKALELFSDGSAGSGRAFTQAYNRDASAYYPYVVRGGPLFFNDLKQANVGFGMDPAATTPGSGLTGFTVEIDGYVVSANGKGFIGRRSDGVATVLARVSATDDNEYFSQVDHIFYTQGTEKGRLTQAGIFKPVKGIQPPHLADSAAANDTSYFSTTSNKMVYKDAGGVVNALY